MTKTIVTFPLLKVFLGYSEKVCSNELEGIHLEPVAPGVNKQECSIPQPPLVYLYILYLGFPLSDLYPFP